MKTLKKKDKRKILEITIAKMKEENPDMSLGFGEIPPVTYIPTPWAPLQTLLSTSKGNGIPKGKYGVIAGPQQTGKSTLFQQIIGFNMQLDPEFMALWTDAENCLDEAWCIKCGIDLNRLIVQKISSEHSSMESLMDAGLKLIDTQTIDMWVIDSVGALIPKSETLKKIEDNKMLDLQRKLGEFFRKVNLSISPQGDWDGTACVLIGQVYTAPTTSGIALEEVRGGNAMKHWAYWRLKTRRGRKDEAPTQEKRVMPDGETRNIFTGWAQHIKVDKTKLNAREGEEIILQFVQGRGLDSTNAAIVALLGHNIIIRKGGWYYHDLLPDGRIQGREKVLEILSNNESLREQLVKLMDIKLTEQEIVVPNK